MIEYLVNFFLTFRNNDNIFEQTLNLQVMLRIEFYKMLNGSQTFQSI